MVDRVYPYKHAPDNEMQIVRDGTDASGEDIKLRQNYSAGIKASLAAACAWTAFANVAIAQDVTADIIVTAQKRSQSLNDVGLSVVAVSGDTLQSKGVANVDQLALISPGFSVGTTYNGTQVFSLRGVNFNTAQISASPTVSTYVDEASLPYSVMTGAMLLDVERVEVLKGPQGTLFGQNATAGSVNVIAAKPTTTLKAGFNSEVNNFGQVMVEGFVSGPVTDTLRARVAASTTQFGDWQRGYYLTNGTNGGKNKGAVRLLLDWTPTERLKVAVNLNANYDKSDVQMYQIAAKAPIVPAGVFPGFAAYPLPTRARDADFSQNVKWGRDTRMFQGILRLDYEFSDAVTLTSLTNYTDYKQNNAQDGDAVAFDSLYYTPKGRIKAFGQEVRLSGKLLDSRMTYILGGMYQKDKILDQNDLILNGYSALPYGTAFSTPTHLTNRSAAVFGNADFEIIPGLTLTGGARYTDTKQTSSGCSTGNALGTAIANAVANGLRAVNGLPADTTSFSVGQCITVNNFPGANGGTPSFLPGNTFLEQSEHNVSWRAGVNFKPASGTLFYGLVSRGFKSGVFPVSPADLVASSKAGVKQEQLTAYEIGAKLSLFDRKVQLNGAVFYYDYKDKQFLTYEPYPVTGYNQILKNIPKSKLKGVEAEATILPIEGLTLHGAMTYIDTQVGSFDTYNGSIQPINVGGSRFNYAPDWSGNLDAEYRFPVADDVKAYLGGSMVYNSKTNNDLGGEAITEIPAYSLFDARVGLNSGKGWDVSLFVRNLTDKYYWTAVFRSAEVYAKIAGMPRTFGAAARFRF